MEKTTIKNVVFIDKIYVLTAKKTGNLFSHER